MAIVDSLSSPANGTQFDCNTNFHVIMDFTYETGKYIYLDVRWVSGTSKVDIAVYTNGNAELRYNDGTWHSIDTANGVFTDGVAYNLDVYGNGTAVSVNLGDVEILSGVIDYNLSTARGIIAHTLATNDIELESWPYGEPSASTELVIADASLALSADGSGSVDGLWDLGAYIYTSGSGIVLEVGGVDVLLAIANASLALSSESPALGPALSIANASLALSSENVVFQSSVSIDANRIARIIFVMKNG